MNARTNKIFFTIIYLILFPCSIQAQEIDDIISFKSLVKINKNNYYKLFFQKEYSFNSKSYSIYIFEKNEKRKLILCEKLNSNKKKIAVINDNIIYSKFSDCTRDGFKKIIQKGLFFTIEQNYCTNRRGQYLQEYFTFKYDSKINDFLLNKYSFNLVNSLPADDSLPPKNYIEDKFPTEAFTAKDFGKIQINNFSFDKIGKIRNKYLEDK